MAHKVLPYLEPGHLELWNLGSGCSRKRPPKPVDPCLTAVFSGYAERAEARTRWAPLLHTGQGALVITLKARPFRVTLTDVGGATGDRGQERYSTSTRSSRGTGGVMEDKNGAIDFPGSKKWAQEPVVSVVLGGGRWRSRKRWTVGQGAEQGVLRPQKAGGETVWIVNLNFRITVLRWLLEDGGQSF